jgi:hypothetical protein
VDTLFPLPRISPFRADDALELLVQPSQALDWHDRHAMARKFADAGNAFTVRDGDGRVIFCGGALEMHPPIGDAFGHFESGHAQLWALFGARKGNGLVRVLRATRQFIAGLPHKRIDAPVADRPEAIRWAEWLGLRFDVRLADAAPGGGDILLYRWKPLSALSPDGYLRGALSALSPDGYLRAG